MPHCRVPHKHTCLPVPSLTIQLGNPRRCWLTLGLRTFLLLALSCRGSCVRRMPTVRFVWQSEVWKQTSGHNSSQRLKMGWNLIGKLIKESSSESEVQCSIESIKLDDLTSWWTLFHQIDSAQYLGIDDRRNQENNISGSNMKNKSNLRTLRSYKIGSKKICCWMENRQLWNNYLLVQSTFSTFRSPETIWGCVLVCGGRRVGVGALIYSLKTEKICSRATSLTASTFKMAPSEFNTNNHLGLFT